MKRIVLFLFLIVSLAEVPGFAGASGKPDPVRAEGSVDAMGSTYSVVVYGTDRERLQAIVAQTLEEARRLDELLSNYRPGSELSQVNRLADTQPVRVSQELFQLLAACVEYSRESDGAFDITVGPLMKVWGFYKGSGHLPHRAEVLGALRKVGYRNLLLDYKNSTVGFAQSGVEMDPGGIGKGYSVDKMVDILKASGIQSALVSAAGSSIYALGNPPNEAGWTLNIKDPKNPEQTAASVTLRNESMSTSGNYEKFFWAEGKLYSHIMDPRTGYPSQGMLQTSVIAPRTIDSEAWTKPYYVQGRDWAVRHKKKDFRIFVCEDNSRADNYRAKDNYRAATVRERKTGAPCEWLQ